MTGENKGPGAPSLPDAANDLLKHTDHANVARRLQRLVVDQGFPERIHESRVDLLADRAAHLSNVGKLKGRVEQQLVGELVDHVIVLCGQQLGTLLLQLVTSGIQQFSTFSTVTVSLTGEGFFPASKKMFFVLKRNLMTVFNFW